MSITIHHLKLHADLPSESAVIKQLSKRTFTGKGHALGTTKSPSTRTGEHSVNPISTEYEVEKILEEKDNYFLLKWKGWKKSFNSWEPFAHLNCAKLLEEFRNNKRRTEMKKKQLTAIKKRENQRRQELKKLLLLAKQSESRKSNQLSMPATVRIFFGPQFVPCSWCDKDLSLMKPRQRYAHRKRHFPLTCPICFLIIKTGQQATLRSHIKRIHKNL